MRDLDQVERAENAMNETPPRRRFAFVVVALALGALPFAALAVLAIRELGRRVLDVPSDLPSLNVPELIPATVMPVLGTALGYFLSYRKPSRASFRNFLIGSVIFTAIAVAVTLLPLRHASTANAMDVTIAIDLAPPAVARQSCSSWAPRGGSLQASPVVVGNSATLFTTSSSSPQLYAGSTASSFRTCNSEFADWSFRLRP